MRVFVFMPDSNQNEPYFLPYSKCCHDVVEQKPFLKFFKRKVQVPSTAPLMCEDGKLLCQVHGEGCYYISGAIVNPIMNGIKYDAEIGRWLHGEYVTQEIN